MRPPVAKTSNGMSTTCSNPFRLMKSKKFEQFEEIEAEIKKINPVGAILGDIEEIPSDRVVPTINLSAIPLLPLRGIVAFETISMPITVGRESSLKLCNMAESTNTMIVLALQMNPEEEDVNNAEIADYGVIGRVAKVLTLPDGHATAFISCFDRVKISEVYRGGEFLTAKARRSPLKFENSTYSAALMASVVEKFHIFLDSIGEDETREIRFTLSQYDDADPLRLCNFICANAPVEPSVKQTILDIRKFDDRMQRLLFHLDQAQQLIDVKREISERTNVTLTQQQKEHFLQQQIRTIQDELNGGEFEDIAEMSARAEKKVWSDEAKAHFEKELKKLERLNPSNPEYNVQYGYLDNFLNLPWGNYAAEEFDLNKIEKVLDRDHYGLEKVKERILEHMAVLSLRHDLKAPIICLFGPPGVGKTSLGRSIADALSRDYARISLGGLHDEAEIRGHRRTYIGAMPGRVIAALQKCGTGNPVIVLDEVDKIGQDYKGDPAQALLEVLDPEQNMKFHDNFVDFDYDLSKVLFIATANSLSTISAPLRDRMEIIEISGYINEEKIEIARRHLVPKELENNGFEKDEIKFQRPALLYIVERYTRESGVRSLEKAIGRLLRKIARLKASGKKYPKTVDTRLVKELLGKELVSPDMYENNDYSGVVTGLAWTSVGGEILFIESSLSDGKGNLTMTGNLGDVMKESATLALQYLKSHASRYGIDAEAFTKKDVHIHVPEGAVPKDGPSAGITIVTSLASSFTRRKVRPRLAMTGEITLRGKVLPVGGIKEKILAAKRAGITDIMLSRENEKDIEEINQKYLKGLTFHYVENVDDVLSFALLDEIAEK